MGIPAESIVTPQSNPSPGFQDPASTFCPTVECLLMSINHRLRQTELRASLDARELKIECRNNRDIPLQDQFQSFIVNKRPVFDGIITSPQGILDPLGCSTMSSNFEPVIVSRGNNRVHFFKRHTERVMIIDVG